MKGKWLKLLAVLACLTLATGVAACGGKDDGGKSSSGSSLSEVSSSEDSSSEEIEDSSSEENSSLEESSSEVESLSEEISIEVESSSEEISSEESSEVVDSSSEEESSSVEESSSEIEDSSSEEVSSEEILDSGAEEISSEESSEDESSESSDEIVDSSSEEISESENEVIDRSEVEDSSEVEEDSSSEEIAESSSEEVSQEESSSEVEYPEDYYTEGLVFALQDDDTYAVTGYTGTATEVVIPSVYNGKAVTSIGDMAFYFDEFENDGISPLTEIVIPDSVMSIGVWAFSWCRSLTEIIIPDSVMSIGEHAFYLCDSLTEIVIPNSVTSIGFEAFGHCSSLTIYCEAESQPSGWEEYWDDSLPVVSYNLSVVWDCNNNDVAINGYIYTVIDGLRYGIKNGVATVVSQPRNITAANIPDTITQKEVEYSVTSIGEWAFYDCSSLTEIVIPDSVISIGSFSGCDNLTEIVIPNSVISIGSYAFEYCDSLTIYCEAESQPSGWDWRWNSSNCPVVWDCKNNEVADDRNIYTVIDGLRYGIKDGVATVVSQPRNITAANIPDTITYKEVEYSVTSIGSWAFYDYSSLTEIVIPDSVTSIGSNAFYDCDNLTEIVIPDGVTSIGYNAFSGCSSLQYTIKDGLKYLGNPNNPYLYLAGTETMDITSATIENDCKVIGINAFYECDSLTEIVIPDGVESIGAWAFAYCDNLTIYCEATSEPWRWDSYWNYFGCPVYWYSETEPALNVEGTAYDGNYGNYWRYVDGEVTPWVYNTEE